MEKNHIGGQPLLEFIIPIGGLSNGLHDYTFTIEDSFFANFEYSLIKHGKVVVNLELDKRIGVYELNFELEGEVHTECDRCSEPLALDVASEERLLIKFAEEESEELDVVYILTGTQELSVAKFIYEFVHLAVPFVKTHENIGERCSQIIDEFLSAENDVTEEQSSVWDSLKDLSL
jgi:uncharacterized metal-binding protein YceD (DUF177 family)